MIFRWSVWGTNKKDSMVLLNYSIRSFIKQFGKQHKYIVFTDDPQFVVKHVMRDVRIDVRDYFSVCKVFFNVDSRATWRKWCPIPRLDIDSVEFHIDIDVFLLKFPVEITQFLSRTQYKFAIMDEFKGQAYQHGMMRRQASTYTPFVNAGLFIQKVGCDISSDLLKQYNWWIENIGSKEATHHDEQGALAIALTPYYINKQLYILPKNKYMIVSAMSNSTVAGIDNMTLMHATYPHHPAFYRFKNELDRIFA